MKKDKTKELLVEHLKKMPIIQIACERSGVARATYYRWRKESEKFRKTTDGALAEGEALITDMSESQLISLIRDKNFPSIQMWLRHHHPKYANKLEVSATVSESKKIELTAEQKALIKEALHLAALPMPDASEQSHEQTAEPAQ